MNCDRGQKLEETFPKAMAESTRRIVLHYSSKEEQVALEEPFPKELQEALELQALVVRPADKPAEPPWLRAPMVKQ